MTANPSEPLDLRGLDLNLLLTLDVLLEVRNVTATAKKMGVTQSAVSHRLARLREFFDDPLLVSAGDDSVLTSKAQTLQAPLRDALRDLRDILLRTEPVDPSRTQRTFTIAAADLAEISILPALLRRLSDVAPAVRIRMLGRGFVTGDALAGGGADFAVAPGEGTIPGVGLQQTRGIRQRMLTVDGFSVMARKDHPRIKERLTLKRYLAETHVLVAPQGHPRGIVDSVLERRGEQRRVAVQVASFLSAPFLLVQTDHLLTCPTSLAVVAAEPLGLRVLKPPLDLPSTRLFLYWHERMHNDPVHQWLRDELLELSGQDRR
jgi:DNA-binding transcriptional LysR family regulator